MIVNNLSINDFIRQIPKAELHLHIEGTFEPELMFEIAQRNKKQIKFSSVDEVRKAYKFSNLQDFLDIYYESAAVLLHEKDFYDLTWAYLKKSKEENITHAELFFDPQTHTERGVTFKTVVTGIYKALSDGQNQLGISFRLILCFLRHLDEKSALKTLEEAIEYKEWIAAVGLDSSEVGNPPSKFNSVFAKARKAGFLTVAHAGEEGDAKYIWEAIDLLQVSRIDHGNRSLEDDELVQRIIHHQIPLTVCPLSNFRLKVVQNPEEHPLKEMLDKGMLVTINSDDPAYFGGYLNDNFLSMSDVFHLSKKEIAQLAKNSFAASFLEEKEKQKQIGLIDQFYKANC
jgi:adenosine deaminase